MGRPLIESALGRPLSVEGVGRTGLTRIPDTALRYDQYVIGIDER